MLQKEQSVAPEVHHTVRCEAMHAGKLLTAVTANFSCESRQLKRRKCLFGLVLLKASVYGHLATSPCACGTQYTVGGAHCRKGLLFHSAWDVPGSQV